MRPLVGLLTLVLLTGCLSPGGGPVVEPATLELPDPTAPGALSHALHAWRLPPVLVEGAQGLYPVDLHGEATVPDGEGGYPVAILMHGRHATCRFLPGVLDMERLGSPCPEARPVMEPVDSYTGYRYLAAHLASHGIAVLSVSANDVNDYDNPYSQGGLQLGAPVLADDLGATARGRLFLHLIEELKAAAAGAQNDLSAFAGQIDVERIGLMGHSRGGEGAIRAAILNEEGPQHGLRAIMALAPSDFARWTMPDVPFATVLPYCDGDVFNLQGAWAYDDMPGGPKHQFLDMGANHNFYNTVWPYDDGAGGGHPHCDPAVDGNGRLSAEEQQGTGVAMMGGFFRHYLLEDATLWPYLEGSAAFPGAWIRTSSQVADGTRERLIGNDGEPMDLRVEGAAPTPCAGDSCPIERTFSMTPQLHLSLSAGESLRLVAQPGSSLDLRGARAIVLRMGVDPDTSAAGLAGVQVYLEDAEGRSFAWTLESHGLYIPPGGSTAKNVLNMLWLPFAEARGVDLETVRLVGLRAAEDVELQFADWQLVQAVEA